MSALHYKRVLIKLSGEVFSGNKDFGIDYSVASFLANQIKEIHNKNIEIGIVIGGGNGTIEFPISHTGWHATFVTTGSLVGDVLLSGSTGNAGIDGGEVHILPVIVAGDDAGSGVTAQTFKTITFDQSAENVGDSVIIEVTQGMGTAGAGARSNATPLIGRINATVFTKD